ncbi:hypothetical protein LINPERHAP1_LOCUS34639 [Linum perenne]
MMMAYHVLGGHRASHNKNVTTSPLIINIDEESEDDNDTNDVDYMRDGGGKGVLKECPPRLWWGLEDSEVKGIQVSFLCKGVQVWSIPRWT